MRSLRPLLILACASALTPLAAPTCGAETVADAVVRARRQLEMAELEYRLYRQVEYARQKRHLDAAIKLTRAEIGALKRREGRYSRYDRSYRYNKPFFTTLQTTEMRLLEAELRLADLLAERSALMRFRGDKFRLLELKIYSARARLAALERQRLGG